MTRLDWAALHRSLEQWGYAHTEPVLSPSECTGLVSMFREDAHFRSRISMERYRFGVGDYAYFADPLPPLVRDLRTHAYPHLVPVANRWMEVLGETHRYPASLGGFLKRCHEAGQTRPTPLLLRYTQDGYNCLHQDLYGPLVFPLQLTVFLSRPGVDYDGGAFLLVEQHPRQQSRGEVVVPGQGEMLIFPSDARPVKGTRGWYRAHTRHGVSRITGGDRYTLGIIFHDAE
ncbi:MAG TPA: 2OG-Fe(II) oxygenase [bacterium]|nr:2OG-Fe(II) oxygenase [bacterium]